MLHATFTLRRGQIAYANLFAVDLSGNFSRVTRLIVMPDKIVAHKKAAKKTGEARRGTKTPPKKKASAERGVSTIQTTSPSCGCDQRARQSLAGADARQGVALALAEREDQHEP